MNNQEIMMLATALSILSYAIGTLLMGSPLPFPSIKRLGPMLLKDSIFSLTVIALSSLIISLPVFLYREIGSDWNLFDEWIIKRGITLSSIKVGISLASSLLSKATSELALDSFLEPLSKSINYCLLTLYSVLSLSLIVRYNYAKLIILGILLSSVPFRLSRSAGCYLIAFSIVFYAGLPLLPSFIDNFSTPIDDPSLEIDMYQGAIRVIDAEQKPVPYAVVSGLDKETGKILFRYTTNNLGLTQTTNPFEGLPGNRVYKLEVEIFGKKVNVEPSLVNSSMYKRFIGEKVELKAVLTNLFVLDEHGVYLVAHPSTVKKIDISDGRVMIYVLNNTNEISLLYPSLCRIETSSYPIYTNSYNWNEAQIVESILDITNASEPLEIRISNCEKIDINIHEPYGLINDLSVKDKLSIIASQLLLNYVLLPTVYLAILFSITTGLASLLSGAKSKLPIRIW